MALSDPPATWPGPRSPVAIVEPTGQFCVLVLEAKRGDCLPGSALRDRGVLSLGPTAVEQGVLQLLRGSDGWEPCGHIHCAWGPPGGQQLASVRAHLGLGGGLGPLAPLGAGVGGVPGDAQVLREVLLHVGDLLTLPGARPGQPHCYLRMADVSQHRVAGPGWPP